MKKKATDSVGIQVQVSKRKVVDQRDVYHLPGQQPLNLARTVRTYAQSSL